MSNIKCQISNKKPYGLCIGNWKFDIGYSGGGFTLIELILYMGIFSILITVLMSMFLSILNTQEEAEATSAVDQNGRFIVSRLIYDIPQAQSINVPASSGVTSSSLQITINNINYKYSLDMNGNLQITDLTDNLPANNVNGYDVSVSNVSFTRIGTVGGKNTVQVSFIVTGNTQGEKGPETRTFQTTIGTR